MSDDRLRKLEREVGASGDLGARSRRARELARVGRNLEAGRDLHEILRNEPTNEAARTEARRTAPLCWTALVAMHNCDLLVYEPGHQPFVLGRLPLAREHCLDGQFIRDIAYLNGEFHVLYLSGNNTPATLITIPSQGTTRTTPIEDHGSLQSMHALHDHGELGIVYRNGQDDTSHLETANNTLLATIDGLMIADLSERRLSVLQPPPPDIPAYDQFRQPVEFIESDKSETANPQRRYLGPRHGIHIENDVLHLQDANGNFNREQDREQTINGITLPYMPTRIPTTSRWNNATPRNYVENPYHLMRSARNQYRNSCIIEVPITVAEALRTLNERYEREARR